jgi:hypothetical protein
MFEKCPEVFNAIQIPEIVQAIEWVEMIEMPTIIA